MPVRSTVLLALLASACSAPYPSEPAGSEAAARERTPLYFRFALMDVPAAERGALDGASLCQIVHDPRYKLEATPSIAAVEGQLAELAIWYGDAGAPWLAMQIRADEMTGDRARLAIGLDWGEQTVHYSASVTSKETTIIDTNLRSRDGHVMVLLTRPVFPRGHAPQSETLRALACDEAIKG